MNATSKTMSRRFEEIVGKVARTTEVLVTGDYVMAICPSERDAMKIAAFLKGSRQFKDIDVLDRDATGYPGCWHVEAQVN